jgi:aminoglycoside N3'-acetyltransferase
VSVGRDNDLTNINANINEEQFERYARWLKQRREINSLRIKADETNLADIKKKRNILLKKQKQVESNLDRINELLFFVFSHYVHRKKNKKCHVYLNNKPNILGH